jgi:type II secretory pathway pseudopilin PulG
MSKTLSKIKPTLIISDTKSFTLVELLIVVGLIAVLSVAIILAINPAELIKQARDSQRLSDLTNLSKAISLYEADTGGQGFMGTSSVVYVSIPDTTSTCANLGLPQLPPSWSYRCVSSSTLQNIDGTGWIPINFNNLSFGKTLPKLPIDPINTTSSGNYYTYVSGGSFELTSLLESSKYQNLAINDGDAFPGLYSTRTSANPLTPGLRDKGLVGYWSFDEASGTIAYDRSGYNNNGTLINGPVWTTGKVGGALSFDGVNDYVVLNEPFKNNTNFSITVWINTNILNDGNYHAFIGKTGDSCRRPSMWLAPSSNGLHYDSWNSNCTTRYYKIVSNFFINTNIWHFVVWVKNNNNYFLYRNGFLLDTDVAPTNFYTANTTYRIGYVDNYWNGLIDEVRIYDRALSDAEIKAIYEATK